MLKSKDFSICFQKGQETGPLGEARGRQERVHRLVNLWIIQISCREVIIVLQARVNISWHCRKDRELQRWRIIFCDLVFWLTNKILWIRFAWRRRGLRFKVIMHYDYLLLIFLLFGRFLIFYLRTSSFRYFNFIRDIFHNKVITILLAGKWWTLIICLVVFLTFSDMCF